MRGTPPSRVRERPSCAWELYPAAGKARESRPWRRGAREGCDIDDQQSLKSQLMLR